MTTQDIQALSPAVPTSKGVLSRLSPLYGLLPLVAFLLFFFVGPLLLNLAESLGMTQAGIDFAQYRRIFADIYYLRVIAETIILGVAVTVICAIIGYPLAYAIARSSGLQKSLLIFAIVIPLLVNVVVRSFGWMVLLSGKGALNWVLSSFGLPTLSLMYHWGGVTIALVHVMLPFMVLSLASTLETLDPRLEEAAAVLGASRFATFRRIVLPLSLEGLMTGSILVFTLCVGSFVTVMLLGSTSTMVLPLLIYQQLNIASDWPFAAAMGMVLLTIVMSVLWLQARLRRTKWRAS
ncbi:ABC transporter permease [Pseudaminobacter sp. 19-2017]|uniref:ABC transporter permease n=1 Tax=Pseudaminobacter soli (ex Zhang et al. 2022) TaxID=2831468 RepID=A0A942EC18_9HYPH|nr:ABC transporter permease [Pseudaminobacter soli]MBS3652392.1 ABC transporter permease [Pseudaminobacter soli]